MLRFVRLLLICFAALDSVALLVLWPTGRASLLYVARQAGICSLAESIRTPGRLRQIDESVSRIIANIRRVRVDGDLELWRTDHGDFWVPDSTQKKSFARILTEDDLDIYSPADIGVRSGDVVIDCGAAQGTFTRVALLKGASTVIAVEPLPQNVECLERTFASEIAAGQVIVSPKAVADRVGSADFSISENPYEAKIGTSGGKTITVSVTTIDRMVLELGLARADFIKMDIEGAERQALAGAAAVLRKYRPRLAVSVNHLPDDPEALPAIVRKIDPAYRRKCGLCSDWGYYIRPEIIHFY